MKIETLKQLESLIDLCSKKGVETVKVDGIELTLREVVKTKRIRRGKDNIQEPQTPEEAALFWSSMPRLPVEG